MPTIKYFNASFEEFKNFLDTNEIPYSLFSNSRSILIDVEDAYGHITFNSNHTWAIRHHNRLAYKIGWRRELTSEEIRGWLNNPNYNYEDNAWFIDWEKEYLSSFTELSALHADLWSRYRKRKCYQVDSFGNFVLTKSLKTYIVKLFSSPGKHRIYTSPRIARNHIFNNYYLSTEEQENIEVGSDLFDACYYINNHWYCLADIISQDWEYCEEHNNFHMSDTSCYICNRKYEILPYSENPLLHLKTIYGKDKILLGVEVEVDTSPNLVKNVLIPFKNYAIAKRDGSILGFEVVTAPATFDIHAKKFLHFPWGEQVISHRDGMHVHVERKALTDLQIGKMQEFLYNPENYGVINKIAGRSVNTNHYCSNTGKKGILSDLVETKSGYVKKRMDSHATALNVTGKETVEIRIFASPANYESFMANLEFVKALVGYTSPGNIAFHKAKHFENFKQFINKKSYPNLWKKIF